MSETETETETAQSARQRATPAEAGAVRKTSLVVRIATRLPSGLLRLWLYVLVVFAFAGLIASTLAKRNDTQTYTVQGTLVYNPIPIPAEAEGLYTAPDLKTMVTFAEAPETLQKVIDERDLAVPIPVLAAMLEVIDPKSRQGIVCLLLWEDPVEGEEILESFMAAFPDHIADLRMKKVLAYIEDLKQEVSNARVRLQAAQNRLSEFRDQLGALDSSTEHKRLLSRYEAELTVVNTGERERAMMVSKLAQVEQRLKELREQDEKVSKESRTDAADQESLTERRLRQNRLNELITERRLHIQVQAKIDAKQQEFERALALYEKDFISLATLQELEAEVRALLAQIEEDEKIKAWKTELRRIDATVVPTKNTKPKSSPIITSILVKKFDLELDLDGNTTRVNQARISMAETRKRIRRFQGLEKQAVNLQKDVDLIISEREALDAQLSSLRKLASYGPREFSVVSRANSQMHAPASGKKKTFITVFCGLVFLLCAPAFVLELLRSLKTRVQDRMHEIGVLDLWPTRPRRAGFLQRSVGSFTTLAEQWAQLVALRLQQLCRKSGSVVLFSPALPDRKDVLLLTRIAQYLALRDERVAVVVTTNDMEIRAAFETAVRDMGRTSLPQEPETPEQTAGLSEYLLHECGDIGELIRHSPTPGIDFLTGGQKQTPIDLMTGSRMCGVIDHLQKHYTMVLVIGPALRETIELEIQARHCDGIVFLLDDVELLSARMRYTLQSLQELDAERLWGMARRPPLSFESEMPGKQPNDPALRILMPLVREICRRGASLGTAALRRGRSKVSTHGESSESIPDATEDSVETTVAT